MGYEERLRKSISDHKSGRKKNPIDKIAYKLLGYKIARKCLVETAIIYGIHKDIDDVEWQSLPDKFVIKPQKGCSESGVYPLVFQGNGLFVDLLRHDIGKLDDFINSFKEGIGIAKGGHSRGLWIEELIAEPIPYDWKLYTFNGRIGMIRQYYRSKKPKTTRFYDKDWNPVPDIAKRVRTYTIDNSLPEPIHKQDLIHAAQKISRAVKYPFVRVDLYDTLNGVYFGEITPHPGMEITVNDKWNEYLGKLWEKAEKELENES